MRTHRFGRKVKLPSTIAIKHEILSMMLQDVLKAQTSAAKSDEIVIAPGLGGAEEFAVERPTPKPIQRI
jgi:hypothetical protein